MAIQLPDTKPSSGNLIAAAFGAAMSQKAQEESARNQRRLQSRSQRFQQQQDERRIEEQRRRDEWIYSQDLYNRYITGQLGVSEAAIQESDYLAGRMEDLNAGRRTASVANLGLPGITEISWYDPQLVEQIRKERNIGSEILGKKASDLTAEHYSYIQANPGAQANLAIENPEMLIRSVEMNDKEGASSLRALYENQGYLTQAQASAASDAAAAWVNEQKLDLDRQSVEIARSTNARGWEQLNEGLEAGFAFAYDNQTGALKGLRSVPEQRTLREASEWIESSAGRRSEEAIAKYLAERGVPRAGAPDEDGSYPRGTAEWYAQDLMTTTYSGTPLAKDSDGTSSAVKGKLFREGFRDQTKGENALEFYSRLGSFTLGRMNSGTAISESAKASSEILRKNLEQEYKVSLTNQSDPTGIRPGGLAVLATRDPDWAEALYLYSEHYGTPGELQNLLDQFLQTGNPAALPRAGSIDRYIQLLTLTGDIYDQETWATPQARYFLKLIRDAAVFAAQPRGSQLPASLQVYTSGDSAAVASDISAQETRLDPDFLRVLPDPVQSMVIQGVTGAPLQGTNLYSGSNENAPLAGKIASDYQNLTMSGKDPFEIQAWAAERNAEAIGAVSAIQRAQQGIIPNPESIYATYMGRLEGMLAEYESRGTDTQNPAYSQLRLTMDAVAGAPTLQEKLFLLEQYWIGRRNYFDRFHNFSYARSHGEEVYDVDSIDEAYRDARMKGPSVRRGKIAFGGP